jgi:hypothetical protein
MAEPCKKCGGTDFTPGGRCRKCQKEKNDAWRKAHENGAGKTKKVKKVAKGKKAAKVAAAPAADLIIDACFGLKASLDGDYLKIEQSDAEGATDTLMLSRTEARQLIANFSKWAGV